MDDTLFILARNNSFYKENISIITSKIVIIKESRCVNVSEISEVLGILKIEKLNIFFIDYNRDSDIIDYTLVNKGSKVIYIEMKPEYFVKFINWETHKFLDYNKDSLYIVRGGNYLDIKNLFAKINGYDTNLGRGGSQRAHVLSPLDFKLSSYLMAIFKFDYKLINYLNAFHDIDKDRYLSWRDKFGRSIHEE